MSQPDHWTMDTTLGIAAEKDHPACRFLDKPTERLNNSINCKKPILEAVEQ
jgi:hypothetical protein